MYENESSVVVQSMKHPDSAGAAFAVIVNDPSRGQVLGTMAAA